MPKLMPKPVQMGAVECTCVRRVDANRLGNVEESEAVCGAAKLMRPLLCR
jgi:hypothetical protein